MLGWLVFSPRPLGERAQSCLNVVKATNAGEGGGKCVGLVGLFPSPPLKNSSLSPLGERVRVRG